MVKTSISNFALLINNLKKLFLGNPTNVFRVFVFAHFLPRAGAAVSPDVFEGDPEGQGPRSHSDPAGNESFVKAEEALVANRYHQTVQRILVQQA